MSSSPVSHQHCTCWRAAGDMLTVAVTVCSPAKIVFCKGKRNFSNNGPHSLAKSEFPSQINL